MSPSPDVLPVAILLVAQSSAVAEAACGFIRSHAGAEVALSPLGLGLLAAPGNGADPRALDVSPFDAVVSGRQAGSELVVISDVAETMTALRECLVGLSPELRAAIFLVDGPFLEGGLAAALAAKAGKSAADIAAAAVNALGEASPAAVRVKDTVVATFTNETIIADPLGLHPGPAAQIALVSAAFDAEILIFDTTAGRGPASARSLIALGELQARSGHRLRIDARGPDAERAVASLVNLIDNINTGSPSPPSALPRPSNARAHAMSAGIAYGPVIVLSRVLPPVPLDKAQDAEVEVERLLEAVSSARQDLATRASHHDIADSLALQDVFLQDPALVDQAMLLIRSEGRNAADAFARMGAAAIAVYSRFEEVGLRAHAADLGEAVDMVLIQLLAGASIDIPDGEPAILIASDMPPSLAQKLDPSRIAGVIDRRGATTSHTAVLLKSAGIPAVCGAEGVIPSQLPSSAIFDGATGELVFDPDPTTLHRLQSRRMPESEAQPTQATNGYAESSDGVLAELFANVANLKDAQAAFAAGALGIGLLRTEMAFLERSDAPSEAEQIAALRPIFDIFAGRTVIARTFDAAPDKPLPFLAKAIVAGEHPAIFERQIAALLQSAIGADLRLLLPKVSEVTDVIAARAALVRVHERLEADHIPHLWPVALGIMVEVPATALMAKAFAAHADFFSLGTNDLAQFTDGHARHHRRDLMPSPALLRLIQLLVEAAAVSQRPLSVCGELAGDPQSALLLFGLGVRSLSMRPAAFGDVMEALKAYSSAEIQLMAEDALALASSEAVASAVERFVTRY